MKLKMEMLPFEGFVPELGAGISLMNMPIQPQARLWSLSPFAIAAVSISRGACGQEEGARHLGNVIHRIF